MQFCKVIAGIVLAASTSLAQAATFDFSGNIANHNDVVYIPFTLDTDATNVRVWTDSFLNGTNFDPITSVWHNGALVGQNDDRADIAPGQTYFDSGLTFANLTAGNYLFTIGTFNNFATGTLLSQGFLFDGQAPIALSVWNQPANHTNMGTYWSVHLDGVSSAVTPVPEPETYALMMSGLALLGFVARRRKNVA